MQNGLVTKKKEPPFFIPAIEKKRTFQGKIIMRQYQIFIIILQQKKNPSVLIKTMESNRFTSDIRVKTG
jgi:hypothetical protein